MKRYDENPARRPAGYACVLSLALAGGCGFLDSKREAPYRTLDPESISDVVPRAEPRSKYGNPPSYEVLGKRYYVMESSEGYVARGIASWYGKKFHGRRTSSGETYDMYRMTAAHKELPLPTYVQVRNLENGKSAIVKVNDRGPFHDDRIIDLSYAAAVKIGVHTAGTAMVEVRALEPADAGGGRRDAGRHGGAAPPPSKPVAKPAREAAAEPPRDARREDRLFVQVGAYRDYRNARSIERRLNDSGISRVEIFWEEAGDDARLYKVQIGPLADRREAERMVDRLFDLGIDGVFSLD